MRTTTTTQGATVVFETCAQASIGFSSFNGWVKKAIKGELVTKDGTSKDFNIWGIGYRDHKEYFTFCVDSSNLEHHHEQLEDILEYCKTLKGIKEFHAPILSEDEPIYWTKES
jgi:hypothetical protein